MAKQSHGRRPAAGNVTHYTRKTLRRDREYGFYWYAWLWHILRPLLVFVASACVVIGVVASGAQYANKNFFMAVQPDAPQEVQFVVKSGSYVSTIGENLYQAGLIRNKTVFKAIVSLKGLTNKFQYGTYQLSSGMDVNEIVSILTAGTSSRERTITIIPGWTVENIADYLVKAGALTETTEFLRLANAVDTFKLDYYTLKQAVEAGGMEGRLYALEGYLAPDTYRVFSDATAESLLRTLLRQNETVVDAVFYQPAVYEMVFDESGELIASEEKKHFETTLSQEQTIILASLIEREAGKVADYAKVAAVFHNRLLRDMPLESDASVAYPHKIERIVLTAEELQTDTPYNTYTRKGLPIGPICNPSKSALEAALYPDMDYIAGEYLYFCATDPTSGELAFSKTKEEHEALVAKYRPLWEQYDQTNAH